MSTLTVEVKIIKELCHNGDFRVFGCSPMKKYNELQLNDYYNFTIKGDLPFLSVGEEYTLEIEEVPNSKYKGTYQVISVPSMQIESFKDLTKDEAFDILMNITTSKRLANNILDAYPNFIELILTEGKEAIDLSKIKGVGEVYLSAYERELNNKYKYYSLLQKLKDYKINFNDCKKMFESFRTEENILKEMENNPYYMLTEISKRSFDDSDKKILNVNPELHDSEIRCEALIMDILNRNEIDCNTRINANLVWQICKEQYTAPQEWVQIIKKIVENSELIYYNDENKYMSKMSTYLAECKIADFVKDKLKNSSKLDIDVEPYRNLGEYSMTDKQLECLSNFCKSGISILAGSAGCVDKDTEFFNGKGWKPISEYNEDDLVLQYDIKNNMANLAKPLRYIKIPCDTVYQIGGHKGVQMCLSDDHNVLWYDRKNQPHKNVFSDIMKKHNERVDGFQGKIRCAFNYYGDGIDLSNEEIELMLAVIADGYFGSNTNHCVIRLKKERKISKLTDILIRANIHFDTRYEQKTGFTVFTFYAPRREKVFLPYWYNCNEEQFNLIRENILAWDGYDGQCKQFSTTVKENADFVQFLFSANDTIATINVFDRINKERMCTNNKSYKYKKKEYTVTIRKKWYAYLGGSTENKLKSDIIPIKTEDGYKYCFTMPMGTLILRKNNRIFTSFNCGKTSSVKGLINLLEDNKMTYTLLSPTGKASRVLSESTNRLAMTIHKRCYQGTINSDVIVIDECTMIGLDTFVMLLDKIANENCRMVLVGDPAQLSSISLGKVFTDLLNANIIPTTELTEIFRYKSNGSLFTATNIRQGKQFLDDEEMVKYDINNKTYSVGNNYKFIEATDEETADIFVEEYLKLIKKHIKPKDIMGLSPFNVKSLGAYTLNNRIQAEINPPKPNENYLERQIRTSNETYNIIFREKDIVMNTKNDYDVTTYEGYLKIKDDESGRLSSDDVEKTAIMNGQIGTILKIEPKGLLIDFDEEIVFYDKFKLDNLLLAYVCSVHKSQGSSVNNVIVAVGDQHKKMLSRGLLYVADTRCRKTCINIGSINAFNSALDVVDNRLRDTWLYELLLEEEKEKESK